MSYSAWGNPQNNFEPLTAPDRLGARASKLIKLLDRGHYDVKLSPEEGSGSSPDRRQRPVLRHVQTADQARQLRGERIAGPELE